MIGFESVVEEAAIEWFQGLGYTYLNGLVIAPDGVAPERSNFGAVILEGRLMAALRRINPQLSDSVIEGAARQVLRPQSPVTAENNIAFHERLTKGIEVQIRKEGRERGDLVWLVDFDHPENNDWLVVNQLTVVDGKHTRRPDIVVYLNGLPMAVIELKNPQDPRATVKSAWNQLQTYKKEIPALFNTNEILVISDGTEAKIGSLTAGLERFAPWRTVDGEVVAADAIPKLKVLIEGLFEKKRLLDYLRHFILWETDDGFIKKIAGYHQFHAANKAVEATVRASSESGDQRIGVIWHTQGSGKSISMVFYAGKIIVEPAMQNPTLVVLTDRNDLDGQLFAQFARARDLVHKPEQASSREHLHELLKVASGGVIFSTIQKFGTAVGDRMPMLSDRRNVVVMVDEAHRSHYEFVKGFAANLREALPHASYIGFTGTPIEFDDRSTPAVFGDYIDTYSISQSVEDGATVRIFYEARLARIELLASERPRIDEEFEEVTEGEEEGAKEKLKTTWAKIEALVGTPKRLKLVAADIVAHWGARVEVLDGKAMVVCMSRRICAELYNKIVALRPEWGSDDDEQGVIKAVMTGSASDVALLQPHIRSKSAQKVIEKRFKDPDDELQIVIVRDMWLTGFDVPPAHTLYVDKPMKGHTLMQAITRVNRVFKDKPNGLVVDYLGIAEQLRSAVGKSDGDDDNRPDIPVEQLLGMLEDKVDVLRAMFHGFDYSGYMSTRAVSRLEALTAGADHVLGRDDGKKRYLDAVAALNKAVGIAMHLEGARPLRDDVSYFQAVAKNLQKYTVGASGKSDDEMSAAIKQIISGAMTSDGVIDVFQAAGLTKPDISILSDDFLHTVKKSPYKNLQIELLKKLLNDEITAQTRSNVVQARKFSELLERTLNKYNNRSLDSAQVILELIEMAKQMRDAPKRGDALGLTEDELAFYDALISHGGVKEVMGDEVLVKIAHDLVKTIRGSVTIDWTHKEAVRATMRSQIKRLLRKHGYPPDKRDAAVVTVIEQAEQVCRDWAA